MSIPHQYPFLHHPCFSESRKNLWARIHLPVARCCNVKCIFCDHNLGSACHTSRPGYANSLMETNEAISRALIELERNPNLKIVAISGPGEPLANDSTFKTIEGIRKENDRVHFCLSTNGVLLEKYAAKLKDLGVESVSISMSAIHVNTSSKMYEWLQIDGKVVYGNEMGSIILTKQLAGIKRALALDITVKVNSILIPEINGSEVVTLAEKISTIGVKLQNIVPLVSTKTNSHLRPPTREELERTRLRASRYIQQFTHCKQCRSDVIGIPGQDRIL